MAMDFRVLAERVSKLIAQRKFQAAEELLLEEQEKAEASADSLQSDSVLSELIELYCVMEPPSWAKAEALSLKRERIALSPYSKLQTAMILHQGATDYARAVSKLSEAIALGKAEGDDKTVYTALGLLGQASLELGDLGRAVSVLGELEQMVARRGSFVVGDETLFLERLSERGLEVARVKRLASTLATVCRDPEFKERLNSLAGQRS
jgi:hypothetical protein